MTMTLYGDWNSGATIIAILLREAGARYRFQRISLDSDAQRQAAFLGVNPMGRLPTLVLADGTVVTESLACALVVAETFPEAGLLPPPGPARATALRWMAFLAGELYPAVSRHDYPQRFSSDPEAGPGIREAAMTESQLLWAIIEAALPDAPFAVGDRFSALDAQIAVMSRWSNGPRDWVDAHCPRCAAIARSVALRPAVAPVWAISIARPRLATAADHDAAHALIQEAYAPWVPVVGRRPMPMDADLAAEITEGQVHVLDDLQGGLAAVLVLVAEADALMIENLAVAAAMAGAGVGRRMIDHAEDEARRRGLPALSLYTNAKMQRNIDLYAALGFTETERREEAGFARVFMRRPVVG